MLAGFATLDGTSRYLNRFPDLCKAGHFRRPQHVSGASDLWLSSIGLGTYIGEPDEATDASYTHAIVAALQSGVNVLDTAINYRHQRSERNIGAAFKQAVDSGSLQRDEVLVCTKAGYLSFDGGVSTDPRGYFIREYVETGVIDPKQLAGGMHCMTPAYLENQIERSRRNLGLETIDVFYVHNPETQLGDVSRDVFHERMKNAFTALEKQIKAGKLRFYGVATWNGFRVSESSRDYLDLFELEQLARQAGGEQHHFRFIQLPFNLAMPEAYALVNQRTDKGKVSAFNAASQLGIAVMGSATLSQGKLTRGLPETVGRVLGLQSDAANATQFSRSAPGLTTALIGMGRREHVELNLKVAAVAPAAIEQWKRLFS